MSNDICMMKDQLVKMLSAEDLRAVDTHEAGEIVDMIKDLAEAEYYCKVTEAMTKADGGYEEGYDDRMGYNRNRSASTGRYMSGPGYRPMVDQEPYVREYLEHPNQRVNWNAMGYSPERTDMNSGNRYGMSYDNYRTARRHYTATKSEADKMEMNEHANKHLMETIASLREIWDNAEPDMKRRMKSDLQNLVAEMNV